MSGHLAPIDESVHPAEHQLAAPDSGKRQDQAGAQKLEETVQGIIRRTVFADAGLAECLVSQTIMSGRFTKEIHGAVQEYLTKDFDKVLSLSADSFHFRRWDEIQQDVRELQIAVDPQHVVKVHAELETMGRRLKDANDSLTALEKRLNSHTDGFDSRVTNCCETLYTRTQQVHDQYHQDHSDLTARLQSEMGRIRDDVRALHRDRQWLHHAEQALSSRCSELERRLPQFEAQVRVAEMAAAGSNDRATAIRDEVQGRIAKLHSRVDESHATIEPFREQLQNAIFESRQQVVTQLQGELGEVREAVSGQAAALHSRMDSHAELLKTLSRDVHGALAAGDEGVERRVNSRVDSLFKERTSALVADMDARQMQLAQQSQANTAGAVQKCMSALEERTSALAADMDTRQQQLAQQSQASTAGAVEQCMSALEGGLKDTKAQADARIDALHERHEQHRAEVARGFEMAEPRFATIHAALDEHAQKARSLDEGLGKQSEDLKSVAQSNDERHAMAEVRHAVAEERRTVAEARLKESLDEHRSALDEHRSEHRSALDEHRSAQKQELDESREQLTQLKLEHEGRHKDVLSSVTEDRAKMNAKLSEHITFHKNMPEECLRLVGQECAHKLTAISNSLLELLTEVELIGGSKVEIDSKRNNLRSRLCSRLSGNLAWSPSAKQRPALEEDLEPVHMLHADPPTHVEFDFPSATGLYLPQVSSLAAGAPAATTRSGATLSAKLPKKSPVYAPFDEVRAERLVDYRSSMFTDRSRPMSARRHFAP